MKLKTKKSAILFLGFLNLAIFCSVLVPPNTFWPAIFLGYCIPPLMALNILIALGLVVCKMTGKYIVASAVLIIATAPFWNRTFQYSKDSKENKESISILSYNAKLFRKTSVYSQFSREMIDWIVQDTSHIKCIQEFSTNSRWPVLDIKGQIEGKGLYSFTYKARSKKYGKHNPGMAIFSKSPIINGGIVNKQPIGINAIIYADILLNDDTLRVYNVHLSSYHLENISSPSNYLSRFWNTINQVKDVVINHTSELIQLKAHIGKCEVPYIITGDFNESPYSYNYKYLGHLQNAFESKGNGFGFTMIKPPLFLRIDNMFFDDSFELQSFNVDHTMDISDHYPIRSSFRIIEK